MLLKTKKQPSAQRNVRNVRKSQKTPVFSYYSNRAPESSRDSEQIPNKPSKPRKASFSFKKTLVAAPSFLAATALVVSLIYISTLSTSPIVQVADTPAANLASHESNYQEEFSKALSDSPLNRSKFLIDTNGLAHSLGLKYPELGDVSIVLPLVGRRPVFKIRPAEPAIVLNSDLDDSKYVVDTNGRVLAATKDVNKSSIKSLPEVRDESELPIKPGKVVLSAQTIDFIRTTYAQLQNAKIPVDRAVLPQESASEVHLYIKGKPYFVKFDLRGEGRLQAGTYIAVKKHLEKANRTPSEYIDVRVPEKAFYR